jgi:tetratricopeptide (TPR) repeat protein
MAAEAFNRGLYDLALQSVQRAIHGHGPNTGYQLDWRFFYLLGNIRFGSVHNTDPEIVNVAEAEKVFLNAARIAMSSDRTTAADSLLAAARAAYAQKSLDRAVKFTQQALRQQANVLGGKLQMAKYLVDSGDIEDGFKKLEGFLVEFPAATDIVAVMADKTFGRFEEKRKAALEACR